MNDEKKSLAAHRREVAWWVGYSDGHPGRAPFHCIGPDKPNPALWRQSIRWTPLYLHPPQAQAGAGMIRSGYRHVVHELVLNIKRAAIRGRNADDESSYIATCDHIENLADEALSCFAALEASHEPE